ncbi:hypothetical protein BGZ61DRAFT_461142 [Ilyonectria robusta]|uniref:uncharacterized protein n=1 Tax=Ilyonectria robusta TaxID=1079257 RepID=UPI001E8D4D4F|nr:uncharacterized protein BGZ61DRAFT_461142 [Ilyonectria robusta]KAH8667773.1 hypothetical protein BGZ61DRAFT_461142 [Ilyonectria robusta]
MLLQSVFSSCFLMNSICGRPTTTWSTACHHAVTTLPDFQVFLSSIPQPSTLCLDLDGKTFSRKGTLSVLPCSPISHK